MITTHKVIEYLPDTPTMFLEIPLHKKLYPNSLYNERIASIKLRLVLNISFRITSSGLVNAAPATPVYHRIVPIVIRLILRQHVYIYAVQ